MFSQKKRKKRRKTPLCDLEPLFTEVKGALMHDLADDNLRRLYCMNARGSEAHPLNDGCSPYMFKKIAQVSNFDKRVIWTTDKSFSELSSEAFTKFIESQDTFVCPEPMSRRAMLVIQKAQSIVAEILGEFDYDEWFDSCAFGKRAAKGLPRAKCYLDTRFSRISGTAQQWVAFKHMLSRDVHLFRAVRKRSRIVKTETAINVTAVPKSWKAARTIAPDTILGGLLSRGLGGYIRKRLEKNTHIDLRVQQERHRRWAKDASKTGHLSTIDMSKASDSFVWRHIELLLPSSWHEALNCVRVPQYEIEGEIRTASSFMLMGSGHTFPLQTLLFYSLCEATRTLLKCRGKVSVYGDDIIVPTRMSTHAIAVMSELGFSINSEKSFYDKPDPDRPSHTFFRESCGGDYKGGVDVRPYMPECDLQQEGSVPRNEFIAWCHKMINGLLDHWDIEEIPLTVSYLLWTIQSMKGEICFVPSWEVDHAGIRHHVPAHHMIGLDRRDVKYSRSVPCYLRLVLKRTKRRRSLEERPYVWYSYWATKNKFLEALDPYSEPLELSGESRKDREGTYRFEPTRTTYGESSFNENRELPVCN